MLKLITTRRLITMLIVGLVLALSLLMSNIKDFDPPDVKPHELSFRNGDIILQGTFYDAGQNGPIALFVHGDGPQDRTADSGYLPLVNVLTDSGISVFSWDKPGIKGSTGNWLDQSMQDRADETSAALTALRASPEVGKRALGLIGFSQAGWVLPRVAIQTKDVSFLVLIGAAISWKEQGDYFTTKRLKAEGQSAESISDYLQEQKNRHLMIFAPSTTYTDYKALEQKTKTPARDLMSEVRFGFVKRNYNEDVREFLPDLKLPLLVLCGADDLNVDAAQTVSIYKAALAKANSNNRFEVVPSATHSLLTSKNYNYQVPAQWTLSAKTRFILAGRDAYAPNVLKTLTNWIKTI